MTSYNFYSCCSTTVNYFSIFYGEKKYCNQKNAETETKYMYNFTFPCIGDTLSTFTIRNVTTLI